MLNGQDIICIASANWDGLWVNSQHVMSRLSEHNRVIYVESIGLRQPGGNKNDLKKILFRTINFLKGVKNNHKNLWIIPPLLIPYHKKRRIRDFNDFLLRIQIKRLTIQLGFKNPILWIFLPNGEGIVGHFNEKMVVYHCVDDYASNPGVAKEIVLEREKLLLGKADIVITTSRNLYNDKKKYNKNTYLMPNVADVEFFKTARRGIEIPADISAIHRPIVGYVGNISNYKFDFELIEYIAGCQPNWSIVLIGPIGHGDPSTNIQSLITYPNVHLLGTKPYEQLPSYIKAFDVCIIPFRVNNSTASSFPMKFNEYLATGKPVVSTALPALLEYNNVAYLAISFQDFLHGVYQALHREKLQPVELEHLDQILSRNSWDFRLEQISELVLSNIKQNQIDG